MKFQTLTLLSIPVTTLASALPSSPSDPISLFNRAAAGTVYTQCTTPGTIALAYDDGPYQYTGELLDILDKAGAKGTFFWTGTLYGCIYNQAAVVKRAYAGGHQIASHTWSHPSNFGSLSASDVTLQMTRLEQAFVNIIGVSPRFMRPPYLATSGNILPALASLGYVVVTDSIDSQDWNGKTAAQSEAIFSASGATSSSQGNIPLMHETYADTVRVLTSWVIDWAKSKGIRIVTVAECLGDKGREYKTNTVGKNSATTC